jgi:hypothetical protein
VRNRVWICLIAATALGLLTAGPALAAPKKPVRPAPAWYTPLLHQQVLAAGAAGVQVAEEQLNLDCPGFAQRGVSAAGCLVYPYGCTANFVFADSSSRYIGTARHCVDVDNRTGEPIFFPDEGDGGNDTGRPVVMQVDTTTVARVGTVVKHTAGTGDPGQDFALIRLDPAVVARWGVNPAIPVVGGPQGIYGGCERRPVKHYGHGYEVLVAQGYPRTGLATVWNSTGYGWLGHAFGGDSGSPVVMDDNRAAGNLTHLVVDLKEYLGANTAGMRMTAIMRFVGRGIRLVNADGTTSSAPTAGCETARITTGGRGRKPGKGGRLK